MNVNTNNITWNDTSTATASNTLTFTTNGTDTGFSWCPTIIDEKEWLPYCCDSYEPKWHILLGYAIQIRNMWN